ncbi:MAG: aminotransferase class IV [Flavobacteriales bacterium]|nr:aminotransferase class IV [Flavobacteriales bacterium]
MNYVLFNGNLINGDGAVVPLSNRAFRYGDGFFETIRVINGTARFVQHHYERVLDSAKAFHMILPSDFTLEHFQSQLNNLAAENGIEGGGRIRITFCRKSGGLFAPSTHETEYYGEIVELEDNFFSLNEKGMTLDIYPDIRKDIHLLSVYKSLNCSLYIMARIFAQQKNLEDALIQNHRGSIIEATSSNLFLVSNGVLYTPSLDDGCVAGTMRMNIINIALENKIKVYECSLNPQNLLVADEIFLTNAISGVRWVSSYRTKRYFNDMSRKMIGWLNQYINIVDDL